MSDGMLILIFFVSAFAGWAFSSCKTGTREPRFNKALYDELVKQSSQEEADRILLEAGIVKPRHR